MNPEQVEADQTQTVLVIDTATESVVTGVVRVGSAGETTELAVRSVNDHRRHAEVLTTLIREVLDEAQFPGDSVDAVVVGIGPGPFTGLRVGMATAAAYGDALGLPVHGVCTLDAISVTADVPGVHVVVTDARRREFYWAQYSAGNDRAGRGETGRVGEPAVAAPADIAVALESAALESADPESADPGSTGATTVVGAAALTGRVAAPGTATVDVSAPTPAGLAAVAAREILAGSAPGPLEPMYLRRPDAVELKDQRRRSLLPVTDRE
ncbi:tRNA (adenosine(37)-N6)-threonylcarbamoyltransferase complex dimerization subunit type 1 TsaB [Gordonia zhaorongruii]|uniref:tRNA (adenosine(37)-N6)-threonylcarbamoyltransferase complex dimerization subunit type 1 TsaB n=1 Tax=Gordonia zhaorongruii TaxID=2597659 RepID=UPI002E268310